MFALALIVLLGFGALAVDFGYKTSSRVQLRNAVDAAALAGVSRIDGTTDGVNRAIDVATQYAAANTAAGRPVDVSAGSTGSVETGIWDGTTFTASSDATVVNAVKVSGAMHDLPTWFAHVAFGVDSMGVASDVVAERAIRGAGEVDCFLPLAIPACLIEDVYGMDGIEDRDLVINPAGLDNVGWARPEGHPDTNWLVDHIANCQGDGSVEAGDPVTLDNGAKTPALQAITAAIEAGLTTWDPGVWGSLPAQMSGSSVSAGAYGNTLEGAIMVFDDPTYCASTGGGSWTGTQPITGFVWAAIYDVRDSGPIADRTMRVRLDTTREHMDGTDDGGRDYGVTADVPLIVQ